MQYAVGKNRSLFLFRLAKARVDRGCETVLSIGPGNKPTLESVFQPLPLQQRRELPRGDETLVPKIPYRLIARVLYNCNFCTRREQKWRKCVVSPSITDDFILYPLCILRYNFNCYIFVFLCLFFFTLEFHFIEHDNLFLVFPASVDFPLELKARSFENFFNFLYR